MSVEARNGGEAPDCVAGGPGGSFWREPVVWWDAAVPAALGGAGFLTGAPSFHWYLPVVGFGLWFLVEYILHRLVLHRDHGVFARRHQGHHEDPRNLALLFTPWSYTVWLLCGVWLVLRWITGYIPIALFVAAGVMAGLPLFEWTHFRAHHGQPARTTFGRFMQRYHRAHHARADNTGFAITGPTLVWDRLLGTWPRRARAVATAPGESARGGGTPGGNRSGIAVEAAYLRGAGEDLEEFHHHVEEIAQCGTEWTAFRTAWLRPADPDPARQGEHHVIRTS